MELRNGDIPSMNNYYNSTNWEKIKNKDLMINYNSSIKNIKYSNGEQDNFSNINESFNSLTGENINLEKFKHNNMQKFIKGGVTQNVNIDNYIIDNNKDVHNLYNNKKETENFFLPQSNIDVINGNKFKSNFLKNRVTNNITQLNNNVFPIEQIKVGPGIDDGYSNKGSGGFHNFNNNVYSMPKNIDDLRTKTNQKTKIFNNTYKAPQIKTSQRGIVTSFDKNRPEKVFKTNKNNWFKTTGANIKQSNRPIENVKETYKQNSHVEYNGGIKYSNPGIGSDDEYGKQSIIVYDNERQTTESNTTVTNMTSMVKALISPVIDGIKFSTKEYTIDSARETGGNIKGRVEKPTTYDPINHIAKTTVKETTIHDNENINLKGPNTGYSASQDIAKTTLKETTIHDNYIGNIKGDTIQTYKELNDKPKTTIKETTNTLLKDEFRNIGPIKYKTIMYNPDLVAKTTVKETTIKCNAEYGYLGGLLNKMTGGYLNKIIKLNNTNKEFTSQASTRGNVSSIHDHRQGLRKQYYDAPQDDTKEKILIAAGHTPNPGNMNLNIDSKDINLNTNKNLLLNKEQYGNIGKIYHKQQNIKSFKNSITKENLQNNAFKERLDASIMKSLQTNELNIGINPIINN